MEILERRTKIIATIGPATESSEMLVQMIERGTNVFRLNMAHARHDWVREICARIREAADRRARGRNHDGYKGSGNTNRQRKHAN